jgi:PAS domain S-box-containing protein
MSELDLFIAALERDGPAERDAYLAQACGGDADLRRRVERLLRLHGQAGSFLEPPPVEPGETVDPQARANEVEVRGPTSVPGAETRYASLSLHGTGGIGQVWRARDCHLEREVALKELRPESAGDARHVARFVREARLTGKLEHPGIVPVYELAFRPTSNQPFYTMRLVRGRTLSDAIKAYHAQRAEGRAEPLDFVGLLTAFVAVCNTIAYAHSRGVLHRDLKGDNVILGDFGEVIVLDWGLAKLMGQPDVDEAQPLRIDPGDAQDAGLTVQGDIVGTPAYMAPEQAEGRLDLIDQRTDIFGLGAIFYEVLTGRPPFVGANTLEVLLQAGQGNPPPPRGIRPDVPPALEAVCLKALAKEPGERYASASDLAQEVQRWQDVQRRQAEDALRRQTEILHSILNGMSEGVIVADADGKLLLINPAAERMIGRPSEATLNAARRTSEFYRPDTVTPLDVQELPSARAIRGEEVDDAEMFIRPQHTEQGIWISANARPLRDPSGSVRGAVVAFRDVTARKQAEQALRESERQFHMLADSIPQLAWMADAAGSIFWYNQRWYDYTGTTLEDMRGWGWQKVHHPDEVGRVVERIRHAFATGEPWEDTFPLRSKGGEYRWFLSRALPIRDADGRVVRWFGTNTDVTEQRASRPTAARP